MKSLFAVLFLGLLTLSGMAAPPAEVRARFSEAALAEGNDQPAKITALADTGSDLVRELLEAWRGGSLYVQETDGKKTLFTLSDETNADGNQAAIRVDNGEPLKDEYGKRLFFSSTEATPVDTTSKLRKTIKDTMDLLDLSAPDPATRRSAVMKLGMDQREANLPILHARLGKEKDGKVSKALNEAIAIIGLAAADPKAQIEAARELARLNSISALGVLKKKAGNSTPSARNSATTPASAAADAVKTIEAHVVRADCFATVFRGLSLGSVLLVAALGLAITFGLMGVINMAHGEMIAVGGYAAYVTQNVALHYFGPSSYQWYFIVAIPVAFISAAAVGAVLEQCVIQFLYRRPLESLLATWGVSLVLQQVFRLVFGSNNVQVNSPSWLLGSFEIHDVLLGYNRLFVIGFAAAIVAGTHLLLTRTPLGLLIRAVMQNRAMAACMGVRTSRVNLMTFSLGSGLAGLAGAFLSQLGNVGPNLGQSYIVDCFMTVVVGGVGNLAGTVWSALGIGTVDQTLQPFLGPVMGKICVLIAIILFLQWRPAGLFAARSRSLED
jgi:urea transport system permease protein